MHLLGIVGVPIPHTGDVRGLDWKFGIPRSQIIVRQQVNVVKDEDIVLEFGVVLASVIEPHVEQLATIELVAVVGLLYNVNVKIADQAVALEFAEESHHVRHEPGQVCSTLLSGVQIAVRDNDGNRRSVGQCKEIIDGGLRLLGRCGGLGRRACPTALFRRRWRRALLRFLPFVELLRPLLGLEWILRLTGGGEMPLRVFGGRVKVKSAFLTLAVASGPTFGERGVVVVLFHDRGMVLLGQDGVSTNALKATRGRRGV